MRNTETNSPDPFKISNTIEFSLFTIVLVFMTLLPIRIQAQECVIIIQGYEKSDEHFASNGADALEEAFKNFPGGASVTKLRPSASNKSSKPGTNYTSKQDLLNKLKEALCKEECKDVVLAFIGHGMGGPGGLYNTPESKDDGGMWVGETGSGDEKRSTFIKASEIAAMIDECKKEVKLFDNHCYASAMYNGIHKALKNKDLIKVALASSKWDEESKFTWPDAKKDKAFYEFLKEFLADYYKIIGDPNAMAEIKRRAEVLKKKAEEDNKRKSDERDKLRKEIDAKQKELDDCNTKKDNLEKDIDELDTKIQAKEGGITDLQNLIDLIDEYNKLKEEQKKWSTSEENKKKKEIKNKYNKIWGDLPKNQQTREKKKELEDAAKAEIEAVKKEFKEKREEYDGKLDKNKDDRDAIKKKLEKDGIKVSSATSSNNKQKVQSELDKQNAEKKSMEDERDQKKKDLDEKKKMIEKLEKELQDLKNKLAAILDHSTLPPVMELVLHYAFISAKANTKSSSAEEPKKPVPDSEKLELTQEKLKTIGLDKYVDGRIIRYKRYINFYKVVDKATGKCVVVGYASSDLSTGWPEQPLITKECKIDCSVLKVAIKIEGKEVIIELVRQDDGKYVAKVDGKEKEYKEFAYYIPYTPPGSRPEKLALIDGHFDGAESIYKISGANLPGDFDTGTSTGEFVYKDALYRIRFLDHGAVEFSTGEHVWTQQSSFLFTLYDQSNARIGEAGFIADGSQATGSLWLEDGNILLPLRGSFDPFSGEFELSSNGGPAQYTIRKNNTYGREELSWIKSGSTESYPLFPNTIPLPNVSLQSDFTLINPSAEPGVLPHPILQWRTTLNDLPEGIADSYIGTRISKKNNSTGEVSYFDFGPGINTWEDPNVFPDVSYTYAISTVTASNMACGCNPDTSPSLYSYPAYYEWNPSDDSIPEPWNRVNFDDDIIKPGYPFPVVGSFPWLPVIAGVVGTGVVTTILLTDDESEDCSFNVTTSVANSTCGRSDGSAAVEVSPQDDYSYMWSNGGSVATISNLGVGSYSVTVTRTGTSCSEVRQVQIQEGQITISPSVATTDAGCGQTNGSAEVNVNPQEDYDYLWSNGGSGTMQTDLAAGEYSVTINLGTCTEVYSFVISETPAKFTIEISSTPATCGLSDGTAQATVMPSGNYTYQWSNGASTPDVMDLPAGDHSLTVTDEGGCSALSIVTVGEELVEYITSITSVPGNCLGEGADIILILENTAGTDLQIVATGPDGQFTATTPPGSINLSDEFTVVPGAWTITVSDPSLPEHCAQQVTTEVEDNTLITSLDDNFEALLDQVVSGNLLNNDSGLSLTISDHTEPSGGTLIVNPDGSFTFTPPIGESGEFTFQYTVTDICGNTSTATVTIIVNAIKCVFDPVFTVTPADCGLNNGAIQTLITPPGNYIFIWSNGATTSDLSNIGTGSYGVTITNQNLNCEKVYLVEVEESPTQYITNLTSSAGNCTGEGAINITIMSPVGEQLTVIVDGPEGTNTFMLSGGQHDLAALMNIPSGNYTITVFDPNAGKTCSQSQNITVDDITPQLVGVNDFYETTTGTPVNGNLLENDMGLGLEITSIGSITGGTVDWLADGSFEFVPQQGFTGTAEFLYTVRDACGNEVEVLVQIIVQPANCDFTAQFINTNASCGIANGTSSVVVDPAGTYFYEWSNGDSGELLSNVPAGEYSVTVEDLVLGCSLVFETVIIEDPPMYISDLEIVQPVCPEGGDILFHVSSLSGGPFDIEVTHPGGFDIFSVPQGLVTLSDIIPIVDGDYFVSVTDQNAGPQCVESFGALITGTTELEITVEAVIPPSDPSSMDGAIIVVITIPGTGPYTILLNDAEWGVTTQTNFIIDGLGVGFYTIQILDANGCPSNILEVEVPFPDGLGLQLETGLEFSEMIESNIEKPNTQNPFMAFTYLETAFRYKLGQNIYESSLTIFPQRSGTTIMLSQQVRIYRKQVSGFVFDLNGGLSVILNRHHDIQPLWRLEGSFEKPLFGTVRANVSTTISGWNYVPLPQIRIGIKTPIGQSLSRHR